MGILQDGSRGKGKGKGKQGGDWRCFICNSEHHLSCDCPHKNNNNGLPPGESSQQGGGTPRQGSSHAQTINAGDQGTNQGSDVSVLGGGTEPQNQTDQTENSFLVKAHSMMENNKDPCYLRNVMLLDNESLADAFCNANYLKDIETVPEVKKSQHIQVLYLVTV
mgnify:CR=1 FL=1